MLEVAGTRSALEAGDSLHFPLDQNPFVMELHQPVINGLFGPCSLLGRLAPVAVPSAEWGAAMLISPSIAGQ
ncbi:MAG: hypothetical protein Q4G26_04870 [Paracoccus sp. (in: a-proteobacteria)]|nr:hypothetical protein [Paracoccus sp. (in: a-proteobacteria)]